MTKKINKATPAKAGEPMREILVSIPASLHTRLKLAAIAVERRQNNGKSVTVTSIIRGGIILALKEIDEVIK